MKLYQLKVIRKNPFNQRDQVVHNFFFDDKCIGFESLLWAYLRILEGIRNEEFLSSIMTYQDDETGIEKGESYLWKIWYETHDTGDFAEMEAYQEDTYEFHFNPVEVEMNSVEIEKDVPSKLMFIPLKFYMEGKVRSFDEREGKIKEQNQSNCLVDQNDLSFRNHWTSDDDLPF